MINPELTVGGIIDKTITPIISSIDNEGFPNTKAMLKVREREGISAIYFHTNTSSLRVEQFRNNNKACLYFFDSRFFRGVMLIGHMEVLTDEKTKQKLWREGDEIYYSQGVTDPDYCVLKFTAKSGRYYSNFKSENFIISETES